MLSKVPKPTKITLNHTTLSNLALPKLEVFVQISLNVNLSLDQTL